MPNPYPTKILYGTLSTRMQLTLSQCYLVKNFSAYSLILWTYKSFRDKSDSVRKLVLT